MKEGILYGKVENLTIPQIKSLTLQCVANNIQEYEDEDLARLEYLSKIEQLPKNIQKRFIDCVKTMDQQVLSGAETLETKWVSCMAGIFVSDPQRAMQFSKARMIDLADHFLDVPIDKYEREMALFGDPALIDTVFSRFYVVGQRSNHILNYFSKQAEAEQVDWTDTEQCQHFRQRMLKTIAENDPETLLTQAGYDQYMEEIMEIMEEVHRKE